MTDHAREAAVDIIANGIPFLDGEKAVRIVSARIQQAIDAATAHHSNEIHALRAEIEKIYSEAPCDKCKGPSIPGCYVCMVKDRDAEIEWLKKVRAEQTANLGKMQARIAALERAYREAVEDADEGWAYASDYFRDKWRWDERAKAHHDRLAALDALKEMT